MKNPAPIWLRIARPWNLLTTSERGAAILIASLLLLGITVKVWHILIR